MASCRIVNESVKDAVAAINKSSKDYETAGKALVTGLTNAIADMEGAAKDAMLTFIEGAVNTFVADQLPEAIGKMAELLELNRSNFEDVDSQIAASIGSDS